MTDFGPGPAEQPSATDISDETSEAVLLKAVSRGSVPAFLALVDRTSPAVRAVLAGHLPGDWEDELLAASYLEVWWLAGCHNEPGAGVTAWIAGIARRQAAEIRTGTTPNSGRSRPDHARQEFAALFHRPISAVPRQTTVRTVSGRAQRPGR